MHNRGKIWFRLQIMDPFRWKIEWYHVNRDRIRFISTVNYYCKHLIYVIRLKEFFFLGSETIRTEGDASLHPCIRKKSSIRISEEKKKRSCLYKKNKTMSQAKIAYFDSKAWGQKLATIIHQMRKGKKKRSFFTFVVPTITLESLSVSHSISLIYHDINATTFETHSE